MYIKKGDWLEMEVHFLSRVDGIGPLKSRFMGQVTEKEFKDGESQGFTLTTPSGDYVIVQGIEAPTEAEKNEVRDKDS